MQNVLGWWAVRFYLIYCPFIFRADDDPTAQNLPPGEYCNLFVVCSWMQVMEPGRQLCVSGTGVHMKPRGWLPKPVKKLGNESILNLNSSNEQEIISLWLTAQCLQSLWEDIANRESVRRKWAQLVVTAKNIKALTANPLYTHMIEQMIKISAM